MDENKDKEVDTFLNGGTELAPTPHEKPQEPKAKAKTPAKTPPPPPPPNVPDEVVPAIQEPRRTERKSREVFGRLNPDELPVSIRMCPPITRRKHAIYEVITTKGAIDRRIIEGPNKIDPQPYELAPSYPIFDRFEESVTNRQKLITYTDGMETYVYENPTTGRKESRVRPKVVSPFFMNNQKIVDIHANYLQYLWWELHPRNESNKFRDNTKRPIFRRVDLDHVDPNTELIRYQLRSDAHNYVNTSSLEKVIGLATRLNIPVSMGPLELRLQLHRMIDAEKDGAERVLYAEPDSQASVKLTVIKAMDFGILDYATDIQQFFISDSDKPIWTVASGKDPIEDLSAHLKGLQGQADLKKISEQLSYWK